MTSRDLVVRVTIDGLLAVAVMALLAGWLVGSAAFVGVLAAGLLSLVNLRWIARSASAATAALGGGRPRWSWTLALGARFLLMFGALAALLASGAVAPVALMAGLAVLPVVLLVRGFAAARDAD